MTEEDLFPIGRVIKLHGVRGKIKIDYFGGDASQFQLYPRIFIKDGTGRPHPYEVIEATPQPRRLILRLKEIETPEEAQALVGKEIFIGKELLPDLPEGEYYWFEILGMEVETEEGRRLGTIKEILPTGAHDVYVVQGETKEIFLPAVEGVIRGVDRGRKVMKVAWMEGLWEREDEV
jgi:16S rRNA processing protein RimM